MKRICILTTQHSVNDVRVTHRIGKTFSELGEKVDWVGPKGIFIGETNYGIKFKFLNSSNRILRVLELIKTLRQESAYDLYWSVDPDSAWVAQKIGKEKNGLSVFDIHERYHDDLLKSLIKSKFLYSIGSKLFLYYLKFVIKKIDIVIGVGQSRLDPFLNQINKSFVIKHYLPKSFSGDLIPKSIDSQNTIKIMHGKAAVSRGTNEVINAILLLKDKFLFKKLEFQFFKLDGAQSKANISTLDEFIQNNGINDFVSMNPPVSFDVMVSILKGCHIGIIAYKKDLGVNAMPNRFFEYIAFGMPVIFPSYSIELMEINSKFDIGISVDMEDPQEIVNAITFLLDHPEEYVRFSNNCINAFKVLNFEKEFEPFYNWFLSN